MTSPLMVQAREQRINQRLPALQFNLRLSRYSVKNVFATVRIGANDCSGAEHEIATLFIRVVEDVIFNADVRITERRDLLAIGAAPGAHG